MLISPTRREDRTVWVEDESGRKISECIVKDDVQDGFSINVNDAVTESGKYYVVLQDSIYNMGEGYTVTTNDSEVRIPYTVLKAPEKTITLTAADPASESKVEALESITLQFDEWVYADECKVEVLNKTTYVFYDATLSINPKNRNMATVTFADGPITDEGSYTLTIKEASVGDQEWFENERMTGKTNATINLYYTISKNIGGGDDNTDYVSDPANLTTVTSLHVIHIWNTAVSEMGCGSGKAVLKRDGAELESIADAEWGEDFNELVLTTSKEYTEDGVYTLEIPEGFFLSGTGDALPAITFTWTVSGGSDGMHSIVITADEDTYSLDGRRMKAYRNGIVIKNGKKTIMMN